MLKTIADGNSAKRKKLEAAKMKALKPHCSIFLPSARDKRASQRTCYDRKALELALILGHEDFKASNRWFECFNVRNGITFHQKTGDEGGISDTTVEEWTREALPVLLASYRPNDIFNCDDTAAFFKVLPNRIYNFKAKKWVGRKTRKEWIIV